MTYARAMLGFSLYERAGWHKYSLHYALIMLALEAFAE